LSINPHYSFADCPPADILLIPGGYGTRQEIHKPDVLQWVRENSRMADLVLSVCTGSFVLAKAGLLEGLTATTHHRALAEFQKLAPHTTLDATKRFVDNGTVITSAGISAGIDMALYVVAKLLGKEQANETAEYMEYDWKQSETDEVMR
jgi:transcriptional regulator GlxA family with amidase domain